MSGRWNWRIVIPIYDRHREIVAYTGRAIDPDLRPKYLTTDDKDILVEPRSLIYGIHYAKGDAIIIAEGPTDVWRLGPGAVALLGIDWKDEQVEVLRRYKRRFVVFDPDYRAQERALKLAHRLSLFGGETEVIEDLPCDLGDMESIEVSRMIKELGF